MPPVIVIAIALAAAIAGWTANGWRLSAEIADIHARNAAATLAAQRQEDERQQVLADAFAMIDADRHAERTKASEENDRLRAAVAAGDQRLFVRATCPAGGMPADPARPRLDKGAFAELSPDARQDHHALRAGLIDKEAKLNACQDILDLLDSQP